MAGQDPPYNSRMHRSLEDWLAWIEGQHPTAIEMGLDRVRAVAERLGVTRPARQVITVGGTNGKGSTVAFLEAIAREAGLRVGAYTSPHLLRYNERVRIDGHDAGDAELVEAFAAIEATRVALAGEGAPPPTLTYFEYGTLAALWLFERAGLDLAILEVGLGGRLDATNLVDADVAIITTVDLDHQDYLGPDRESIGAEKVGIARAWKPLVLGDDDPPSSVLRRGYAIGAHMLRIGCDFFVQRPGSGEDPAFWQWREVGHELTLPMPALIAPSQLRNAAVAIAALRASDLAIDDDAIVRGIAAARVPGRLQRFHREQREVVVDVGHNPQAARELAAWLRANPARGRNLAVYAALGDKDLTGVVAALDGAIEQWHLAGLADASPRGLDVDAFAARLATTGAAEGARHADVATALVAVTGAMQAGDRALVFGSFHTVAAALRWLASEGWEDGSGQRSRS